MLPAGRDAATMTARAATDSAPVGSRAIAFAMKRFVFSLSLLSLLLVGVADVRAQEGESDAYRQLVSEGLREFASGRFEEALVLFLDAHEIEPNARTFRALGATSYELRRYADAVSYFSSALESDARPLSGEQREEVERARERAARFIGHFMVLVVEPEEGYRVTLDGNRVSINRPLVLQAPDSHELEVSAPGYAPFRQIIDVRGRENETIEVVLEVARTAPDLYAEGGGAGSGRDSSGGGRGLFYGGIASLAVGGAGLLTWAVAGGLASGNYSSLDADTLGCTYTGGDCISQEDFDSRASEVETQSLVADIGLGVGLGAAVIGTILLVVDKSRRSSADARALRLQVDGSPEQAGLAIRGSF